MRGLSTIRRLTVIVGTVLALFVFASADAFADGENMPGTIVTFSVPDEGADWNRYWIQLLAEPGDVNFYTGWLYADCTSLLSGFCSIYVSGFPDNGQVFYWRYTADTGCYPSCYAPQYFDWFINGPSGSPLLRLRNSIFVTESLSSCIHPLINSFEASCFRWLSNRKAPRKRPSRQ